VTNATLTNNTSGNAATATTSSYVSGTLSNSISGSSATSTYATYSGIVTNAKLTNGITTDLIGTADLIITNQWNAGMGTNLMATNLVGNVPDANLTNSALLNGNNNLSGSNTFNGTIYMTRGVVQSTNTWALDTALPMNTNKLILSSGAATGGITNVENVYPVGSQFSELFIKATGDITFTNPTAWVTSDMVDSRIITNGNYAQIAVEVNNLITNLIIVQSK
jgi:hypothetical protein